MKIKTKKRVKYQEKGGPYRYDTSIYHCIELVKRGKRGEYNVATNDFFRRVRPDLARVRWSMQARIDRGNS